MKKSEEEEYCIKKNRGRKQKGRWKWNREIEIWKWKAEGRRDWGGRRRKEGKNEFEEESVKCDFVFWWHAKKNGRFQIKPWNFDFFSLFSFFEETLWEYCFCSLFLVFVPLGMRYFRPFFRGRGSWNFLLFFFFSDLLWFWRKVG